MSKKSLMLSSRFDDRQFMVAVIALPRAPTEACVARKSSRSSSSAGLTVAVPPVRTIAAIASVRPGISAGSMYAPPLKVRVSVTSGNSLLGAM